MSAEGTADALMPPPASTNAAGVVEQSQYGNQLSQSNGAEGASRKNKKKNKKKEKRKEKRQQQAIDRIQFEEKLSVDPLHKAKLEFEERVRAEHEAREKLEQEQKRLQWEAREIEIQAEIERKKQEEELRRLEVEEKKRQDAEEREVGLLCFIQYPLCLVYMCLGGLLGTNQCNSFIN